MSQPLPFNDFHWEESESFSKRDIMSIDPDAETGYILEVDLLYPEQLHDAHNDYPLAPERLTVHEEMLSQGHITLRRKYSMKFEETTKLVPNLFDKSHYIIHIKLLQLYMSLGLELQSIHRVLSFHQSAWLRPYISINTDKRSAAKSAFEKDFYKLMNNAVYGKTCENLRKRVDVRIIKRDRKRLSILQKPNCKGFKIFDENLIGVNLAKFKLKINKPTYVGFAVLEISKHLMYTFHYNFIRRKYQDKAKLLFTDTDSLMYEIEREDLYQDFHDSKDLFDFASFPKDSQFFDATNNKVIGKFKDEENGIPIIEFVGPKAKLYSYQKENRDGARRAKGIQRSIVRQKLSHQSFHDQLFHPEVSLLENNRIQSDRHHLFTSSLLKKGLNSFDDKRFLLGDGVHTLAHGNYRSRALIKESIIADENEEAPILEASNSADDSTEAELSESDFD